MPAPFDGAVLRKARKAESNSGSTADPDIVVLDRDSNGNGKSDRDEYLDAYVNDQIEEQVEFLVLPESTANIIKKTGTVQETAEAIDANRTLFQFNKEDYGIVPGSVSISPTPDSFDRKAGTITYQSTTSDVNVEYERKPLRINYVKNDDITRFSFDSRLDKWLPRKGKAPDSIGKMPEDGLLEISEVISEYDPRVVIGSKDSSNGTLVPTTKLSDGEFKKFKDGQKTVTSGEAVVNQGTSEILFAQDLIDNNLDNPVFSFQYNFPSFQETAGFVGTADEDVLVLNPIPKDPSTGEPLQPLIRAGFETYLDVNPSSSSTGNEDAVWDESTGRLTFQTSEYDGRDIYYDGVVNNTDPIDSLSSETLGELADVPNPVEVPKDSNGDPLTFDGDKFGESGFILYIEETGEVIPRVEKVEKNEVEFELGFLDADEADGFNPSYNLAPDKAQIAKNNNGDWAVQLGLLFRIQNANKTLKVGTGDFYIENGVTFRMRPSPNDPKNTKSIPDATASERLTDEVLDDSIKRGPFASIEQIPLTDIPGYDGDSFFKRKDGLKETILDNNKDIVHDFNNQQIRWSEVIDNTHLITSPVADFNLDHSALHNENSTFELDEGQGFQELDDGSNVNIDFDAGQLSFIERIGETLYEGAGKVSGDELTTNEVEFNISPPPSDPTRDKFNKPILIIDDEDAYRVVEEVSDSTVKVHQDFPSSQDRVNFELIEAPEVIFRYGFHSVDLSKRVIFPRKVVDEPDFVPDGESFEFYENGQQISKEILEIENLGTPVDDGGNQRTLKIPQYFRNSDAGFDILRGRKTLTDVSPSSPSNEDEYSVDLGTGEITFDSALYNNFKTTDIIFKPKLSQGRSTGPVEVLKENREIGLPDDVSKSDLSVRVLIPEDGYEKQRGTPAILFNTRFKTNESLIVEYTDTDDSVIEEDVGFRFREEVNVPVGASSFSFGAGKEIDRSREATVLINGSPDPSASIDLQNKTVQIDPLQGNRRVTVDYSVLNAQGEEQAVILNNQPRDPTVIFDPDKTTQDFLGDHTGEVQINDVLVADNQAFFVENINFDGTKTEIELQASPVEEITDPDVTVTSEPITQFIPKSVVMEDNPLGASEIRFFGDQRKNIIKDHILKINRDPYHIRDVRYDQNNAVTRVELSSDLLKEYSSASIEMTPFQVYEADADILEAQNMAISGNGFKLVRFDPNDDGVLLENEVDYTFRDDGRVRLDVSNTTLPHIEEYWLLAYTGRKVVEPTQLQGNRFNPRLRTSYVRFINASPETFVGEELRGTYTFRSRDSFYYRVVPLETLASEVTEDIDQDLESGSSGPTTGFRSDVENFEAGNTTFPLDVSNLRDRDRVGRRQIEFYHGVCNELENYMQILDGRVIGDKDGRFKFFRADDGQRGGEDPVTGELIDYYANPDGSGEPLDPTEVEEVNLGEQEGYIRNSIDDIVLTSKTPYLFTFNARDGITLTFQGTFKNAWEPSRISRFYPEQAEIYTLTTPDRDLVLPGDLTDGIDQKDGKYSFIPDFGNLLADLKKEDILSISVIADRQAKGWLIDGEVERVGKDKVKIKVGMKQDLKGDPAENAASNEDGNLKNGWIQRNVPGFEVGDKVNLGRTRFDQNQNTGLVDKNETIYAHNMKISSIDGNEITLTKVSNPADFDLSTDPDTLQEGVSNTGKNLTEAFDTPQRNDTLFTTPENYYRLPIDMGANQSEGELRNRTLPKLIRDALGQRKLEPKTFLDVKLNFKNTRTRPRRFPALDGRLVDDDEDNKPPYAYPLPRGEAQAIEKEKRVYRRIEKNTSNPKTFKRPTFLSTSSVDTPSSMKDYPKTQTFNSVIVEGVKEQDGESSKYSVSELLDDPTGFTLVAKNGNGRDWTEEQGLTYTVNSLYESTGYVDPNNDTIWIDDQGRDFTDFNGGLSSAKLHIGGSTYDVTTFNDGSVEVSSSISESSDAFRISLDSQGLGAIQSDLRSLFGSGIDFSDASGQFEISGSTYNDGVYDVDFGENERLYPVVVDDPSIGAGAEVPLQVNRGTKFTEGNGSVSGGKEWSDSSTNFNVFQSFPHKFLNILQRDNSGRVQNVHVYEVESVSDGSLTTKEKIQQSGTFDYVLSSTREFGKGAGAVESSTSNKMYISYSSAKNLNVRVGNKLIIYDTSFANAGRYEVTGIGSDSTGTYLLMDKEFRAANGSVSGNNFPLKWNSYRERRESPEVENDLRNALLERSPIYQKNSGASTDQIHDGTGQSMNDLLVNEDYEANHPSTPSLEVLNDLLDVAIDLIGEDNSAEIKINSSGDKVLSTSIDLSEVDADNSDNPDYVLIENGKNQGFYQVKGVVLSKGEVTLKDTSFANEKGVQFTNDLPKEDNLQVRVFSPDRFTRRTYEVIFYEYINVLETIDGLEEKLGFTFKDPDDLFQDPERLRHYGNPLNSALQLQRSGNFSGLKVGLNDRLQWITGDADGSSNDPELSLRQEINGILKGRERLYDLRYAWIDFRINQGAPGGSLIQWERIQDQEDEAQIKEELDKLRSD